MRTISRWLACLTTLALLLALLAPVAYAQPVMPHTFYGTVKINGSDAPTGTVIKAKVGGVERGSYTTTEAGKYGSLAEAEHLVVQGDIDEGATINFYVNGYDSGETAAFVPGGGPTEVNLTATIPPTIDYSPSSFSFSTNEGTDPSSQTLSISNSGVNPTAMAWSVSDDATWLSLSPASGSSSGEVDSVTLSVDVSGRGVGSYSATITISASGATNTPQTASVSLTILPVGATPEAVGITTIEASLFGEAVEFSIDNEGVIQETLEATSADGNLTLTISKGTTALDEDGDPLTSLEANVDTSPPSPPEAAHIIGLAYDFGPAGATFDPPITLEYTYDPNEIPEGVAETNLVLAYYDEAAGKWVTLDSTVDTVTNTVTASVSHFTTFALLGYEVEVPPPPAPAAFTLSSLTISPVEVNIGETVTITISVANTGGESGRYEVVLKINGVVEATKEITVAAGKSEPVSFTTAKDIAATYSVDVNGLTGSFTVKKAPVVPVAPPPPPKPIINWPVLGGIIAAVIVIGLLIFFVVRRRA